MDRLDALGDEIRPACHRCEVQVGPRSGKLAQKVCEVRLVARALAAEDVGIEKH
jgi:hypothetical protein